MKTAFLGLGKMGTAIARHLLKSGTTLTVWNRTRSHAEALAGDGARVASTPAEAVKDAEVVFTIVMDDGAMEDVLFRSEAIDRLPRNAVHVAMSTLSVALSKKLEEEHHRRGQKYVAAPVFGRPHIAEAGKLWTVVGGASEPVARIRPLLDPFSRGVSVVSEQPWSAHALKLGGNFLITAMIAGLTEGFLYAEAMQIEPAIFLEAANNALFQSKFYEMYGSIMLHPPEQPGGTVAIGEKDTRLFREAAQAADLATPLADQFYANFHRAIEAGMKDDDWAAGYLQLQRAGK